MSNHQAVTDTPQVPSAVVVNPKNRVVHEASYREMNQILVSNPEPLVLIRGKVTAEQAEKAHAKLMTHGRFSKFAVNRFLTIRYEVPCDVVTGISAGKPEFIDAAEVPEFTMVNL